MLSDSTPQIKQKKTHKLNYETQKQLDPNDQSYFQLIQIVGSSGRYQKFTLIIWCAMWFIAGQILLGTPFLLYNPPYQNCPSNINETCNQYVCKLPHERRKSYIQSDLQTLATAFGDYHCENSYKIQLASTLVYFGSFVGYLIVSWMNDNLGRRKSAIIALAISFLGIFIIASSLNLFIAQIGLFLAGFGIDPAINTSFYFITETVQNNYRQKQSILIQFFFSLAGMANVIYFIIFQNWRVIYWMFFLIPTGAILFAVYWYVQETPQFLVMFSSIEQTVQALQKIALSNRSQFFIDSQNQQKLRTHIQKLKINYQIKKQTANKKYIVFWDMFRYPSIRFISIYVCILSFSIYLMYYGPFMLIEKYNLNVYISTLVLTSSDILVYPIVYFKVQKMKRIFWAKIFFCIAILCSLILLFILGTDDQLMKIVQMILIFIFRFSISFEFALFAIYENELFPSQVRGGAIGFASALGTVASTLCPVLFGQIQKTSFPAMVIFIAFGSLSLLCCFYMPQTLNKKPQEQLEEFIQTAKEQNLKGYSQRKHTIQLVEQMVQAQ